MCSDGQPIKYCIRNRWIVDEGVPVLDGELAANDGGALTDAVIQKFQKIMLASGLQLADAKIVEDQQVCPFVLCPQGQGCPFETDELEYF